MSSEAGGQGVSAGMAGVTSWAGAALAPGGPAGREAARRLRRGGSLSPGVFSSLFPVVPGSFG
ncbi:hypothetical protein DTB58_26350 [Streptomyces griseus]|nr:hypothetical protein [Streptomyces griseus]